MRKFDYSFLKQPLFTQDLLKLGFIIHEIKSKEKEKKDLAPRLFEELTNIAKIQSVKASNAIEGIRTSDKRLLTIMNDMGEPLSHDEKEIAGYRDALNLIHENPNQLSFTLQDILGLHNTMLTPVASPYSGQLKQQDNLILEMSSEGYRQVRFKPLSAKETPEAIRQLIFAYLEAKADPDIHPLLLIPCVILDFLSIHPFTDGNGRISRLLTLMLLYQHDYDIGRYISIEHKINETKASYYSALKESSLEWESGKNNYKSFIVYTMQVLYQCYKDLEKRIALIKSDKIKKSIRIKTTLLESLVPISKQELWQMMPDISVTTIEKVIGELLKEGQIIKYGQFKTAKYKRK
jgi:Fic family protein